MSQRKFFVSHQRVSGFPETGEPDLWGGLGHFRGSLGHFRVTSGLLLKDSESSSRQVAEDLPRKLKGTLTEARGPDSLSRLTKIVSKWGGFGEYSSYLVDLGKAKLPSNFAILGTAVWSCFVARFSRWQERRIIIQQTSIHLRPVLAGWLGS